MDIFGGGIMENFFENLLSNGELQEEIAELKAENEQLLEQKNNVMRKNIIYYQALTEIKEIVYNRYEYCKSCEDYRNGYCIGLSLENCEYDFHNKILQKISEVGE